MNTVKELTNELNYLGTLSNAVTVSGPDHEAQAWMDGDASHLGEFEPYDWGGADPYTLGEPVRWG
ncbi:hypothetical protein [Deinococcus marmoris]|uniref:hypothetical protein n=1 Tax=Deinococcus marmoris TaxID=249408 RepID=UPI0012DEA0D0|nr:hypothetical protein [Deinococcus marmoris]